MGRGLIIFLSVLVSLTNLQADAIDASSVLQNVFDEALLDIHGGRWSPEIEERLRLGREQFGQILDNPEAQELWKAPLPVPMEGLLLTAETVGLLQARLQHVAALEMISNQRSGNIDAAREWRSIIRLPKFASSVEGALALQRLGGSPTQRSEVSKLLAKEYVVWQITRAREKADALIRLIHENRATPELIYARAAEIQELSRLPASLLELAIGAGGSTSLRNESEFASFLAGARQNSSQLSNLAADWRLSLEAGYPNLLSPEDVQRRERIVLKLLRLIPKEYQSGVRDGEITIPIEYREAKSFTIQARQIVNELIPVWRQTKAQALEKNGQELLGALENLEGAIERKTTQSEVDNLVSRASNLLQDDFGLALKRAGMGSDVVA
jgi:high-affinity iron transporter